VPTASQVVTRSLCVVRTLIVDGNALIRARLAERLVCEGVDVVGACTMAEAMSAIAESRPDAIVLDVHLDAGTGTNGLARLRLAAPLALIVVLTNECHETHAKECMRRGANAFFDKSTEFDDAVALVLRTRLPTT